MEVIDGISAFAAGLGLGFIVGSWIKRATKRLEYERGRSDGIRIVWPYLVGSWIDRLVEQRRRDAGDQTASVETGAGQPLH